MNQQRIDEIAARRASYTKAKLTGRETDALELHRAGMSTRNIALALGISRSSARERIRNATRKLAKLRNHH